VLGAFGWRLDSITQVASHRYYSPQIDCDLIPLLYRQAKARRVPMTRLASSLIREGLMRQSAVDQEHDTIREEPPDLDPGRQEN
jgi:hypothetical protein